MKISNEEKIFKTPRMEGVKVTYCNDDGKAVLAHTIIRSRPSIAIIVCRGKEIALIRQFRSTTGQYYLEIPAGCINEGESEKEAAIRETREETGLLIRNVEILVKGPSLLDPSKSDENYGVAVAETYEQKSQILDEMEQIDSDIIWMEENVLFSRIRAQMFKGEKIMDDLFMSGHSLYALMAYMLSK